MKKLYSQTNKNRAIKQMTQHERRETQMRKARQVAMYPHHIPLVTSDPLPYTNPRDHHHMSKSRRHHQDIFSFRRLFPDDPATKVGVLSMSDHTSTNNKHRILSRS